jgi:hypothetical protein
MVKYDNGANSKLVHSITKSGPYTIESTNRTNGWKVRIGNCPHPSNN